MLQKTIDGIEKVNALRKQGLTVEAACKQAGVYVSSYYGASKKLVKEKRKTARLGKKIKVVNLEAVPISSTNIKSMAVVFGSAKQIMELLQGVVG